MVPMDQNDMEIDKVNETGLDAMVLTEKDLDDLEISVKEFKNMEMDDDMIDNDDLLGDEPCQGAEQIDALTQLSPTHAEYQEEPLEGQ